MSVSNKQRLHRLIAQKKNFKYNLSEQIKFLADDGNYWKFSVQCSTKTPFSSDLIYLTFKIPDNYPFEEPSAYIEYPDRFLHPNINQKGKICYYGETKPGVSFHIVDRIRMIQDMLQNPNPKNSYSSQTTQLMLNNHQQWFKKAQQQFNRKKI